MRWRVHGASEDVDRWPAVTMECHVARSSSATSQAFTTLRAGYLAAYSSFRHV